MERDTVPDVCRHLLADLLLCVRLIPLERPLLPFACGEIPEGPQRTSSSLPPALCLKVIVTSAAQCRCVPTKPRCFPPAKTCLPRARSAHLVTLLLLHTWLTDTSNSEYLKQSLGPTCLYHASQLPSLTLRPSYHSLPSFHSLTRNPLAEPATNLLGVTLNPLSLSSNQILSVPPFLNFPFHATQSQPHFSLFFFKIFFKLIYFERGRE